MTLFMTIKEVLEALRRGESDFKQYIEMFKAKGLSQGEAEDLLERLLKMPDEEEE